MVICPQMNNDFIILSFLQLCNFFSNGFICTGRSIRYAWLLIVKPILTCLVPACFNRYTDSYIAVNFFKWASGISLGWTRENELMPDAAYINALDCSKPLYFCAQLRASKLFHPHRVVSWGWKGSSPFVLELARDSSRFQTTQPDGPSPSSSHMAHAQCGLMVSVGM